MRQKITKNCYKIKRGTWSERDLVLTLLKHGIPAEMIFYDLYLQKYDGNFSQIDLVVIADVGIIVFEVKDYSGWIYGTGYEQRWTKVLAYDKEKYRFYNPNCKIGKSFESNEKDFKGQCVYPI